MKSKKIKLVSDDNQTLMVTEEDAILIFKYQNLLDFSAHVHTDAEHYVGLLNEDQKSILRKRILDIAYKLRKDLGGPFRDKYDYELDWREVSE